MEVERESPSAWKLAKMGGCQYGPIIKSHMESGQTCDARVDWTFMV